jgi:hypothetical protein
MPRHLQYDLRLKNSGVFPATVPCVSSAAEIERQKLLARYFTPDTLLEMGDHK